MRWIGAIYGWIFSIGIIILLFPEIVWENFIPRFCITLGLGGLGFLLGSIIDEIRILNGNNKN